MLVITLTSALSQGEQEMRPIVRTFDPSPRPVPPRPHKSETTNPSDERQRRVVEETTAVLLASDMLQERMRVGDTWTSPYQTGGRVSGQSCVGCQRRSITRDERRMTGADRASIQARRLLATEILSTADT